MYSYIEINFFLLLLAALCLFMMLLFSRRASKTSKKVNEPKIQYTSLIKNYKKDNLISIDEIKSLSAVNSYPFPVFFFRTFPFNLLFSLFFIIVAFFYSAFYDQIGSLCFVLFLLWEIFWLLSYIFFKRKSINLHSQIKNKNPALLKNPNIVNLTIQYDEKISPLIKKITFSVLLTSIFMNLALLLLASFFNFSHF
ncbi:hypothetical protein QS460_11260 [Liquorilactobacillus mali]|uniref:Uncharacterized protein n=1 Tax=Liquorilactobacillus mali TaxID=1618 RepID=A0A0R2FLL4_9LACO|nr:hypothetical protein [Liquorilactobacillus mali]KRN29118.1 hypothetical protein IV36_GL000435 [Liquorilactobacillus mali]MDN7146503.1 hypothetical protein [Liquorilactobacillus mali]